MRDANANIFIDIMISLLYLAICFVAANFPTETAFVFCSEQFEKYVNLWFYVYVWSEQFCIAWPWQH